MQINHKFLISNGIQNGLIPFALDQTVLESAVTIRFTQVMDLNNAKQGTLIMAPSSISLLSQAQV